MTWTLPGYGWIGPVAQDYNPPMPLRAPELQISYDEISIPVSAKCSLCGEGDAARHATHYEPNRKC